MNRSETSRDWATWGIAWGLGILLVVALAGVLPIIVMTILKLADLATVSQVTHGWPAVAYSAETECAFGGAAAVAWVVATRHLWFESPWRWRLWLKGLAGGLAIGAALTLVGVGMQQWLGHTLPSDAQDLMGPAGHHAGPLMAMLVIIVFLAPVMEEWLFRGTLQTSLARAAGAPIAVGVVSVIFALVHELDSPHPLAHPWLWAPILPLAVVLGIVRVRSASMSGNIGIHMGFNLWAALLMLLQFWHS
ncbi:CPBP family intramembrane glutamic endopeptidase [Sulfobacillus harzensis]|uniref:CPBP family intramembrane metalloprotease n=1 Tax=Sulfobacillus harzensis TaxID=2729629 RepID=A0A7Y0Q398_9FIRM|nr:CPBP family intramembrane glutamic endopeptidase [Sulfobacillus harzensis]NMP24018.1 CPBP family intramembrane metalloprotease [Sulfobacillus harzensis]